ncbi:MAG: imidazoleglycerol-phosphate dehydratase HisB [Clostridiales Family XIII bacterium]|jgi:imidazoleglycerol-phosphate dehydratase|nr:imidazoleglycerol-phosphate dehydratase HisB [Clostridiales Family XIII bacterium]
MSRKAKIKRETKETDIVLSIDIDGTGKYDVETGVGFLDHMLTLFSKHGLFDLTVRAKGDINVDFHHTVEDIGIVLGKAIKEALGDKKGIKRYGFFSLPMDETLTNISLDLGGRAFLVFNSTLNNEKIGEMDAELIEEFFRAVAFNLEMTLHVNSAYGNNNHHIAEGIFKSFAKALDMATLIDERIQGVMSTKGMI